MKKCLVYTVKNDTTNLNWLTKSLTLFRDNLNPFVGEIDIIFFPDAGLEGRITALVTSLGITNRIFIRQFPTTMPPYDSDLQQQIDAVLSDPSRHSSEKIGYKKQFEKQT